MRYRCPVCKKPLTKEEYEKAMRILGEHEKHVKELRDQLREMRQKAKAAKKQGAEAERARTRRLLQGKEAEIQRLKERVEQLQKGSTPQTEGLEFEDKLAARLRREFREDDVRQTRKGGDVLHTVKMGKKVAGVIVYECKRAARIQSAHVRQAFKAKQSREAEFAVLVTTGRRKGFTGLMEMTGVLVVSPLGVIPLARLLRAHLIEMVRAQIARERRLVIAQQLMTYITSPQFKNPIEEVVRRASDLQEMLFEEMKGHVRTWRRRWENYVTIHWDSSRIQENVQLVLQGREAKAVVPARIPHLQLPPPTE